MDHDQFDDLTRQLARGRSRRSLLRGLIGGGVAVMAARTGAALAAPETKVSICHRTGRGAFQLISVSASAIPAHEAHGDGYLGTASHCTACGDVCTEGQICGDAGCQFLLGCPEGSLEINGACFRMCGPSPGPCSGEAPYCVCDNIGDDLGDDRYLCVDLHPLGRCESNTDCPPGFICDPELNDCVPFGTCESTSDCPTGSVCDPLTDDGNGNTLCVPSC